MVTGISWASWSCASPTLVLLQWGPVVVTGIRFSESAAEYWHGELQWGPVVVTGISILGFAATWLAKKLQWGPVVVTGISVRGADKKVKGGLFAVFSGLLRVSACTRAWGW